jgi:hypothetical protein
LTWHGGSAILQRIDAPGMVLGANVRGAFLPPEHVLPVMIAHRYDKPRT